MLVRAARGEAHDGDWLVADRQTAGRGRQGRNWVSPQGNLYASGLVALMPGDPPAPTLALVAGIATIDALGAPGLMLKWPNDVLFGTAKLAGILLERQGDHVVVGVGINLAHGPDLPNGVPTKPLAALGYAVVPDRAIDALSASFAAWLGTWRSAGLAAIRPAWLKRAHPKGMRLAAAVDDGRLEGTFDGLTEDCALQLRLADGTLRAIHAGDVFLI